jgi:serine protease Do
MKYALLIFGLTCAAGAGATASTAPLSPEPAAVVLQYSFRRVSAAVKPAVVSIDSVFHRVEDEPQFFFGSPEDLLKHLFADDEDARRQDPPHRRLRRRVEGLGSGVITDPRGYILTNEHVVGGAEEIKVIVRDPEERIYQGKVVGTDSTTDLAVVKIEPGHALTYAVLGDSDKVRVGDWALAIGSPFGLEQTVTLGVISAVRQSLRVEERLYSDFLQTDAAINQGNSGGPLVNVRGEVVGINTAIYSPTGVYGGIGFAIPSNQVAKIMRELIEKGRIVRGWIGVETAPLDAVLAKHFRTPSQEGVLINAVVPGSPAAKAKLRRGDVVVEFDGQKVAALEDFTRLIAETPPKTQVSVRLIRDGRPVTLSLVAGERPTDASVTNEKIQTAQEDVGAGWQGARLRTACKALARRYDFPDDAAGAVVVGLESDTEAEQMGLRPGDLILSINGRKSGDAESFLRAAKDVRLEDGVVLDVNRRGEPFYLSYRASK